MKLIFNRKNLISFSIVVFIVAFIGTIATKASTAVANPRSSITFNVYDDMRPDYEGAVTATLYRLADITAEGRYDNIVDEKLFEDIMSLAKDNDPESVKAAVESGTKYIESLTSEEKIGIKAAEMVIPSTSCKTVVEVDNGVFLLYFDEPVKYGKYKEYTFENAIISAPTNNYLITGGANDEWNNDVVINLKYGRTDSLGNIEIKKTVDTFNTSMGSQAFVFSVEAKRGDDVVYSNVVSLDFDKAGTKSVVVKDIPANSEVEVTELYSGASYKVTTDSTVYINGLARNETTEVSFLNSYNDKLIDGSIATVNTVSHSDEDGFGLSYIGGAKNEE